MTLVGFKGQNHPQQIDKRGALDEVDDRGTPPELYDPLHERFGFTLDAAASHANAKCERYYTRDDCGLTSSWAGQNVWCNPPYNAKDLAAFVAKAWEEWRSGLCPVIVMLVPANRPEQAWWQDHVEPFRDRPGSPLTVEFLRDRRRFVMPGQTEVLPNQRPPFGVALLIWQPSLPQGANGSTPSSKDGAR